MRTPGHADTRDVTGSSTPHAKPLPDAIWGDWLLSFCMFPFAAAVAAVEGGLVDGMVAAACLGWVVAGERVVIRNLWPDKIVMSDQERDSLTWLLKITAVASVVGFLAVIAIALGGGDSWLPIWPGLVLGFICGIQSILQLARTTRRARRPI